MTSPPIPPVFCLFLRADGISLVNRDLPLQFVENGEIFFGMKLWNSVRRGRRIQASSFISWLAITEGCWSRLSARNAIPSHTNHTDSKLNFLWRVEVFVQTQVYPISGDRAIQMTASARHKAVHGAVHIEIIVAEYFLQLLSVLNAPEVF